MENSGGSNHGGASDPLPLVTTPPQPAQSQTPPGTAPPRQRRSRRYCSFQPSRQSSVELVEAQGAAAVEVIVVGRHDVVRTC